MYHGYTEPEDKIEERKRRILGTVAPSEDPSTESDKQRKKAMTPKELKRQILLIAVLYPIAFVLGDLLGRYIQTLVR